MPPARWRDALLANRARRAGLTGAVVLMAWALAAAVLPEGLPLGIVLLGVVLGSLSSLTALGLVLVYRSTRIINFAQAEIGGLAASIAVILVAGEGLSYWLAVPLGLAAALATGGLVEITVVRRFFTAPRLIVTVATIGVAQILGSAELALPNAFSHLKTFSTFKTPFGFRQSIAPIVFNGDHVVAVTLVPVVLIGLAWFFNRTDAGIGVRGAADSQERALLLGIPVRRLSFITWTVAGGLSGLGAILTTPVIGSSVGTIAGPKTLLAPLAAAVVGRFESLPVTFAASLAIGVAEQGVFWSYPRSSTVDVALFVLILVALLVARRKIGRVDEGELGGYVAAREVRPIPEILARLPEVRFARAVGALAVVGIVGVMPWGLSNSRLTLAAFMAIFGIIAASLVVLTGWAGQISLGQFAFVGLGAATTGSLLVHDHADLILCLLASAAVGAFAAVLIGLPALRVPGLFLAAVTLAFAVPVSTYLLSSIYFPKFTPSIVNRPLFLERWWLDSPRGFYYLCLLGLVLAVCLARNFRRSRIGRAVVAVRDNERRAAAVSISPVRMKLIAFAMSGALAGFAGGLYVLATRGIGFGGFDPVLSVEVFTMVVVGGLGSLSGALLGAAYVEGAHWFLRGGLQLLATGAGLLVVLMLAPGGLAEVAYGLRDRGLRLIAQRRGLSVPTIEEHPVFGASPADETNGTSPTASASALLACEGIDAGYGRLGVLFGVSIAVDAGEIVALLGTNGAGKSTALRVISGLVQPTRGAVIFDGEDITDLHPIERVKRGIVTVPGGHGVFGSLTVRENLRLAGWIARRRRDHDRIEAVTAQIFELFPVLEDRLDQRAALLSGGEQQMLTIAEALLCNPRLLMIDELSLGLAPLIVSRIVDVVRELNDSGITVVIVEQSVNVASTIARRAIFMEKGQVRFTGPTAELSANTELLRAVFLGGSTTLERRARNAIGPEAILEARDLRKRFGGVTAIDGLDLDIKRGAILGIIGANGAGKTTAFDIWSGFLAADSGRVICNGIDITSFTAAERAGMGMGRTFQDIRMFPSMTVTETLAVSLERHVDVREPLACVLRPPATGESERAVRRRVDELLDSFNLGRYRDAFVSELSTGTRRVLELACAAAHRPDVLLLDEPSSGLAQREAEAMADLLLGIRDQTGTSLGIIEHDIPLVSAVADELACMHLGVVVARGAPTDVLRSPVVVASYLGTDEAAIFRSGTRARRRPRARAG